MISEVFIDTLPAFEKMDPIYGYSYSYTGLVMKIRRNSLGQLVSGYFFPTGSFALLSIISFLIKPDMVSGLILLRLGICSTNLRKMHFALESTFHVRGNSQTTWTR